MNKLRQVLEELKRLGRGRSLNLGSGTDFTSNDYLGMASHPALRQAVVQGVNSGIPLGSGGSRLLRGHRPEHEDLETFSCRLFNAPRSLFFATGFQANYALFSTLPDRHDLVIYDSLIHASVREGLRSCPARSVKFAHNDVGALEDILKSDGQKVENIWIAIESLYSMDGDMAPLLAIFDLARQYNAMLIVDEAHATGIYGEGGRGLCWPIIQEHGYRNVITLHTCGKAIGVAGGLVCGSELVVDSLINLARAFIYSTAPMPLQALLVRRSLEILSGAEGEERRRRLFAACQYAQRLFGGHGTPILPVVIGEDARAVEIAAMLQKNGFDIRAIRPPTVPEGTARLRISVSCETERSELDRLSFFLKDFVTKDAA
ncbi:MAG: 8-amino-7-oxononanoate synthase [Alphaproteobacteria bacterium]|nr:8-amino-7-oxononanoate synthase [Alphaproteobacteria bacterium]MBP7758147.1 8-amino-7-oxononanoate synthase [Alphaproteobacteria bacterium]MBP7761420.1 8-amino-7-oxononanoate synthase [Alphaproteobacteria bacterium]MBP7903845.1 8-amino-7-oxononanoate synthase [Alphaproteobacteria bacterium]